MLAKPALASPVSAPWLNSLRFAPAFSHGAADRGGNTVNESYGTYDSFGGDALSTLKASRASFASPRPT